MFGEGSEPLPHRLDPINELVFNYAKGNSSCMQVMERMQVACAERMRRFGIELILVVYPAFTAIGFIVT